MRSKKTVWRLVRWTRQPSKFLSYIHAITDLYLCTYVLICVYNLCFYIYIYTYIYTHIHMYMCVYIYTCMYWQFYSPGSYVFINLFIHTNLWTGLPNNHNEVKGILDTFVQRIAVVWTFLQSQISIDDLVL